MACKDCEEMEKLSGENTVRSWTSLPKLDIGKIPDDLDFICGSDEEMLSWRFPMAYLLDRIKALEKEVVDLKKGKNGK